MANERKALSMGASVAIPSMKTQAGCGHPPNRTAVILSLSKDLVYQKG